MKTSALNPRLRMACIDAGLPARNTMYCFRRERIIHAKHTYGTEAAKTIAGHVEGSNAHEHYDTVNVGDIDIQAYNACRESMSREDARKMFRQANQSLYNQTSSPKDYQTNLRKETDARVFDRERTNPELAASARCRGYTNSFTGAFKAHLKALNTPESAEVLHNLDAASCERKPAPKKIRQKLRGQVLEEIAEEMRGLLKDKSASGGITATRAEIDLVTNKRLAAVNSLLRENDSGAVVDEGVDERSDLNIDPDQVEEDEAIRNPKGEPGAWKFFEDNEEVVVIGVGHEGQDQKEAKGRVANDALDARKAFLLQHIAANECPTSGLTCILDPSSTAKARSKKWNRAQLHKHLRSKAHSC
ncbi:hypothetical protein HBH56_091850 [Parastagonospora nodorum]|nr:hypothetical protein HBH56_091850 [Parastagonospora nodorum]KAH3936531.1 hypothetical protein HBH54_026490 [Parastagonospora nodorum]KAH3940548.1 hypothetical protein HBH53_216590 [Parastagonospora nodorum]KAH3989960.1 hypothetical protein HBH52_016790 [Parastagonospora nodorum]KAH3998141.1 hypothetical protein HBI10_129700 [Parastagonospora nodorum]